VKWVCSKCLSKHWYLPNKCKRCKNRKLTRQLLCPNCGKELEYKKVARKVTGQLCDAKANLPPKNTMCQKCGSIIKIRAVVDFVLTVEETKK
jgi:primosomal protein N'